VIFSGYDKCKKSVDELKSIITSESLLHGKVIFSTDFWKYKGSKLVSTFEKQTQGLYCFYHAIHCLLNKQLFCNDLADKVIPALANYIYPGVVVDNGTGRGLKSPEYFKRQPRVPSECAFEELTNFSSQ
jgi:hypothetical protein